MSVDFFIRYILYIAMLLMFVPVAYGDVVILKNGDRLSGRITSMDHIMLVIETAYAGTLHINRDGVESVVTDEPVLVMFNDETVAHIKVRTCNDSPFGDGNNTVAENTRPLPEISYINPSPYITDEGVDFTGEINLGGVRKGGNTVSDDWTLDLHARIDRGKSRYLFEGTATYESKDNRDTELKWFVQGRYNRFLDDKWYALGNFSYEFDKFKGLDMRTISGFGAGYQFFDSDDEHLSAELGPGFVYEEQEEKDNTAYGAMRWSASFRYPVIGSRLLFFHTNACLWNMQDTRQLVLRTSTGLTVPLSLLDLQTSFQFDWDWENVPDPGKKRTDTRTIIKAGYSW